MSGDREDEDAGTGLLADDQGSRHPQITTRPVPALNPQARPPSLTMQWPWGGGHRAAPQGWDGAVGRCASGSDPAPAGTPRRRTAAVPQTTTNTAATA